MYKVVCKPVIVPLGDYCYGRNEQGILVTCQHYDNEGGHPRCSEAGFNGPMRQPTGEVLKPAVCRTAHEWTEHSKKGGV